VPILPHRLAAEVHVKCYDGINRPGRKMTLPLQAQHYLDAQDEVFEQVLRELKDGQKQTHWMWFIFPQAEGLGQSSMSKYYSIKSLAHASEYANHPILGSRLATCTRIMNSFTDRSAEAILGCTDATKFWSSMTLFGIACADNKLFLDALDKYFEGHRDKATLRIVAGWSTISSAG
jgi:uncharacterized protein (DUF1810 family)